jgi:hypothetical protein
MFGSKMSYNCSLCINCYNSNNITRSFEVDSSFSCSGSYFLHNCENVHDSMFCFNVKNLRYAIGNVEVGREKFLEAKAKLTMLVVERLEKERRLPFGIFELGLLRKSRRPLTRPLS